MPVLVADSDEGRDGGDLDIRVRLPAAISPQQSTHSAGSLSGLIPSSMHARYAIPRCMPSITSTVSSNTPIRMTTSLVHLLLAMSCDETVDSQVFRVILGRVERVAALPIDRHQLADRLTASVHGAHEAGEQRRRVGQFCGRQRRESHADHPPAAECVAIWSVVQRCPRELLHLSARADQLNRWPVGWRSPAKRSRQRMSGVRSYARSRYSVLSQASVAVRPAG